MWFHWRASPLAIFVTGSQLLKEILEKPIPAENWANKKLQEQDRRDGMSEQEILRNVERGRYFIPKEIFEAYPTPHRDPIDNKIIIENEVLYFKDADRYGGLQAQQWLNEGKYNLNEEEMRIEQLRIKRKYDCLSGDINESKIMDRIISKLDYENTEAVQQWKKAHTAESKYYK